MIQVFGNYLQLEIFEKNELWNNYLKTKNSSKNETKYGRWKIFTASGNIKFSLRDYIVSKGHKYGMLRELAEAFHEYMDEVFGKDRPRIMVWV